MEQPAEPVVRLTSAVVEPLIGPLFVPASAAADAPSSGSGRLMAHLLAFRGEDPALGWDELFETAAELVHLGLRATGHRLSAAEESGTAGVLARTLWAAGELDTTDAEAVRLGPPAFAQLLHSAVPGADRELSPEAARFYDELLAAVCLHFLRLLLERSPGLAGQLPEQAHHIGELVELNDAEATSTSRDPRSAEDVEFEERYLRHVIEQYDRITICGIDLDNPATPADWPLEATYLSLSAEFSPLAAAPATPSATSALSAPATPSATSSSAPDEEGGDTEPGAASVDPVMTAEKALARHERVLLRGVAGSGKTTVIQWLAVSTAGAALPEELQGLRSRIPFVLPVRRFAEEGFPAPGDFLSVAGHELADEAPEGWVARVLAAGRALLLIDGIDEVPEPQRRALHEQLRPLLREHPGSLCLVTSRPTAVEPNWLAEDGFTELTLAPMNRDQVAAFITAWHTAARMDRSDDADAQLDRYRDMLLRSIPLHRELRVLATNPLMCGLICALNVDRAGFLPQGRKELYEAAMAMLLQRRDPERQVVHADPVELERAPRERLLRKLAHRMLVGGHAVLDHRTALREVERYATAIPAVALQDVCPEQILDHLLLRTGVLREQPGRSVEFVHRTVQDYLAAKEIVEQGDLDLLLDHAHEPEWEEVIRMAVAHARPAECAMLLQGLLAPGALGMKRQRRRLMAAACLEHVTEVDPETYARVRRETRNLVSPSDDDSALRLGFVGPIVLEMLPDPATVSDEQAYRLALTVTRIDDDAAVDYLAGLRDRKSLKVRTELARGWRNFETERYAEEVIRHLNPEGLFLPVRDRQELAALRKLGGRPQVQIGGPFTPGELVDGLVPDGLTHLWLSCDLEAGMRMGWLSAFPHLMSLRVDRRLPPVSDVPDGVRIIVTGR
ncbi:NACHT domain-containing protein [Streptomyces marispadix]|uniref:NACHT domain-containing protein n=1 Tax=Streptomyces marispadix TaxID=2922868 RepID=A0ABS9T009_9ACTN|nr:NACHT domain-containing protein [Streptomyces marispadix]MCH6161847.1 NACHT domain-containing protein [Streptomyces marispadix]